MKVRVCFSSLMQNEICCKLSIVETNPSMNVTFLLPLFDRTSVWMRGAKTLRQSWNTQYIFSRNENQGSFYKQFIQHFAHKHPEREREEEMLGLKWKKAETWQPGRSRKKQIKHLAMKTFAGKPKQIIMWKEIFTFHFRWSRQSPCGTGVQAGVRGLLGLNALNDLYSGFFLYLFSP